MSSAMEQRSSEAPTKSAKGVMAHRKSGHSRRATSPARKGSSSKKHREPARQPGAPDEGPVAERTTRDIPADADSGPAHKRSDSIGSASLARMQNLILHGREDQPRPSESAWRPTTTAWLSCARTAGPLCYLCAALVGALVLAAFFFGSSMTRKVHQEALQDDGCTSRGCKEHLERLFNSLNKSVDPCWNPTAYVCDNVHWKSEIVSDALTDMLVRWYQRGATFLEQQRRPSPASAMYKVCVSKESHTSERLEEIRSFLRGRGLHWPRRATGVGATKHALNVILDLLINWGVNFWLEISLKQLPGDTRYSLCMTYSQISLQRAKWLNYSKAYGKRLDFVRTMYKLYGAGDTPMAQIRDLVADEDSWVRAVIEAIASANRVVLKLRLAHLDQLTPNVSSHRWLDYLNYHLRPHHLLPDDRLLLVDKIVSEVTNRLFERFSNAALLDQVAWRFVEDYSYANSYAAAVATFGNEEAVARFRPRNCYSFTESRFQRSLFVARAGGLQDVSFLDTIDAIFEDLRNTTQRLLSDAAPWIDPAARVEAAAILRRMQLEPFRSLFGQEGDKPLLARFAIRKYLDLFPVQFPSPLKGWTQAADLHRRAFPGWPLDDSLLHRHGEYSFPVQYDYWWNSVYLHLAVAAPPMFYTDAPVSVNYAGFGAAVARQLVRGFDALRGSFLDSNRTVRSWMSRATRKELQEKIWCAGDRPDVLMQVAATQVAYRAFREHREAEPRRYAVSKDISLTPDMLFFVTLCRSLCGQGDLCAKVLSNMAAFGRAFSCKPGAPMNPADKCSFFEQA